VQAVATLVNQPVPEFVPEQTQVDGKLRQSPVFGSRHAQNQIVILLHRAVVPPEVWHHCPEDVPSTQVLNVAWTVEPLTSKQASPPLQVGQALCENESMQFVQFWLRTH